MTMLDLELLDRLDNALRGLCPAPAAPAPRRTAAAAAQARCPVHAPAREIAREVKGGRMDISDIDEDAIAQRLYTRNLPDPDLLIRTSGE
ncbi:MAG: undecaprenyl diphosphate synthase family protein, partial [Gemmobacter sp.]